MHNYAILARYKIAIIRIFIYFINIRLCLSDYFFMLNSVVVEREQRIHKVCVTIEFTKT